VKQQLGLAPGSLVYATPWNMQVYPGTHPATDAGAALDAPVPDPAASEFVAS
jgi:hypothetical protein